MRVCDSYQMYSQSIHNTLLELMTLSWPLTINETPLTSRYEIQHSEMSLSSDTDDFCGDTSPADVIQEKIVPCCTSHD